MTFWTTEPTSRFWRSGVAGAPAGDSSEAVGAIEAVDKGGGGGVAEQRVGRRSAPPASAGQAASVRQHTHMARASV